MDYLGWLVSFEKDGTRHKRKLINFFTVEMGSDKGVWALLLCKDTGEISHLRVIPNNNEFKVCGKSYRPTKA